VRRGAGLVLASIVLAGPLRAQSTAHLTATSAAAVTRVDPAPGGAPRSEFALDLTALMGGARLAGGRLRFAATLNLEGATIPDGVLSAGAIGEGYIDRRHPHAYIHEVVATAVQPFDEVGVVAWGVSAGRGFVAFGTDDPMNRPVLRYPINHHWAQIVERAFVTLGVRAGPVVVEGTLFNGDEPERPWQAPHFARFGDSWAFRVTGRPVSEVEVQVSHAAVASPEHRDGAGPSAAKWSASARLARSLGAGNAYGLFEWARTSEADGFFVFGALLAEGELRLGVHRPYYRFERTTRPEEERTLDPFRTVRPHHDDALIGVTRWTTHTVGYGIALPPLWTARFEPMVEVTRAGVAAVGTGLFRPAAFYGSDTLWSLTIGVRVRVGPAHRMGRYGVLVVDAPTPEHHGH
jgi:hypothetical protein